MDYKELFIRLLKFNIIRLFQLLSKCIKFISFKAELNIFLQIFFYGNTLSHENRNHLEFTSNMFYCIYNIEFKKLKYNRKQLYILSEIIHLPHFCSILWLLSFNAQKTFEHLSLFEFYSLCEGC